VRARLIRRLAARAPAGRTLWAQEEERHCAGGSPADVVGFVCFEVREVTVTPAKIIRGRFLCPSDPLFAECDLGPARTGGDDYGLRAQIPVLVR